MSTVNVKWQISDEAWNKEFIETGERPEKQRKFFVDLTEQPPFVREALIGAADGGWRDINMNTIRRFSPEKYNRNSGYLELGGTHIYHDEQPGIEMILAHLDAQNAEREKAAAYLAQVEADEQAERERMEQAYAEYLPAVQALIDAEDLDALWKLPLGSGIPGPVYTFNPGGNRSSLRDLASEARAEITKRHAHAEKDRWIKEHGSDHLKRAWNREHNCQRLYVIERAAKEAPEFVVDFDDEAKWKDRSTPTVAALDLADAMDKRDIGTTEIVWLTSRAQDRVPSDDEYERQCYEGDELPAEAVVVTGYLGKYDLVRIV